jgi:Tfp pilus assembly protein PilX
VNAGVRLLHARAQRVGGGRYGQDEVGASLILALVMITVISVALLAVLGLASTSFRALTTVHDQRAVAYAADSAVQTAIAVSQKDSNACGSVAYGTVSGQAVTADCSLKSQGVTAAAGSMPSNALWAGAGGAAFTTGGTTSPGGPVASNGTISGTLAGGPYTVQATGACPGVTADDPSDVVCNTGKPVYADPNYPSEPIASLGSAANPLNPVPTCTVANGVLQFAPGYYTDVRSLQAPAYAQSGKPTCRSGYLYFKPGVYYFDFGFDPALSTDAQWDVLATQVIVGGEAKGWDPNVANSTPGVPGSSVNGTSVACKTEKDGATTGVQFVFGGSSEMSVSSTAKVELCADPSPTTTSQQIAIYGQQTGDMAAPQTLTRAPTTATPSPATGWTGLTPVNKVLPIAPATASIDGQAASYTVPSSPSTQMTLGHPALVLPVGSINVSYELQIQHSESVTANVSNITVKVVIGACNFTSTVTPLSTALTTLRLNSTNLSSTNYNCLKTAGASNFSVLYTATAKSGQSFVASLDGVDLVATYTPPTVRAPPQTSCLRTDVINCSILTLGAGAKFVVWGTVDAPLASINASYTSGTNFQFRRGVLVRALQTSGTPPADTTVNFCLGYGTTCGPRVLLFSGKVGGIEKVKALVQYVDTPVVGNKVQVLSWNVVR